LRRGLLATTSSLSVIGFSCSVCYFLGNRTADRCNKKAVRLHCLRRFRSYSDPLMFTLGRVLTDGTSGLTACYSLATRCQYIVFDDVAIPNTMNGLAPPQHSPPVGSCVA